MWCKFSLVTATNEDGTMSSKRKQRFEQLLSTSMRRLSAIARSYARGDEDNDLLQEILLQVWRGLKRFEGRSAPDTWAYRVAVNTAIDWQRRGRVRFLDAHQPIGPDELTTAARSGDELVILEDFVHTLGPADRALFVLYLEDLSYRQIAEITGLTENHVGVKIHRFKRAFTERYVK